MGYNGTQTEYITDTSALTATTAPQRDDTSNLNVTKSTEAKGLGDVAYVTDYNLVNTACKTLTANSVGTTTATSYFIVSRHYGYGYSGFWTFNIREIGNDGSLSYSFLTRCFGNNADTSSIKGAIRPIVTLKSGVKASSGDGSSGSPYVLP